MALCRILPAAAHFAADGLLQSEIEVLVNGVKGPSISRLRLHHPVLENELLGNLSPTLPQPSRSQTLVDVRRPWASEPASTLIYFWWH